MAWLATPTSETWFWGPFWMVTVRGVPCGDLPRNWELGEEAYMEAAWDCQHEEGAVEVAGDGQDEGGARREFGGGPAIKSCACSTSMQCACCGL